MSVINPTYLPTRRLPITAATALPAYRFVNHLGCLCQIGETPAGVTELAAVANELIALIKGEVALVEAGYSASVDDKIVPGTDGVAIPASLFSMSYDLSTYGIDGTSINWVGSLLPEHFSGVVMGAGVTETPIPIDCKF